MYVCMCAYCMKLYIYRYIHIYIYIYVTTVTKRRMIMNRTGITMTINPMFPDSRALERFRCRVRFKN